MISADASEYDHKNQATAVTKIDMNNKIKKKMFSFIESDNE